LIAIGIKTNVIGIEVLEEITVKNEGYCNPVVGLLYAKLLEDPSSKL
jgi:hypothetical protein